MLTFLRRNVAWMLLSLGLSLALWIVVTIQQNPVVVTTFTNIPVQIQNLPAGLTAQTDVQTVSLRVAAPSDIIARLNTSSFQALINAAKVGPGGQDLPITVTTPEHQAQVDSVSPGLALVRVEPIETKNFAVELTVGGTVPFGYVSGTPKVTPSQVTLRGPKSDVDRVESISVPVSLDGVRSNLSQTLKPIPLDANGLKIDNLTITPERVLVEIPVDQQASYKTVPITPQLAGNVAFGYQVVGILTDPTTITVVGDPKALEAMQFLPTKPVSVASATGDVATNAELDLPTGVALARSQTIVVRVLISPVVGSKVLAVAPRVTGLPPNTTAAVNPPSVEVTLSGPIPVLTQITPSNIQVQIDATGVITGTYTLKPNVKVPSLLKLVRIDPQSVAITVQ